MTTATRPGITFTRLDRATTDVPVSPLPADLLERAVARLRIIAVMLPVTLVLMWLLPVTIGGRLLLEFRQIQQWPFPMLAIVASLGMVWATRSLPPSTVLRLGLAYHVVVSYALVSSQYWGTFTNVPAGFVQPDLVGFAGVAIWIIVYGIIVPTRPRRTLPALLLSASAPPVTYLLNVRYDGAPALEAGMFLHTFVLPYVVAVAVAYIAASIVHGLGREVREARELGSYRLEQRLGEGGMGQVWRASHRLLARPAAVKLIRREAIGGDPAAVDTAIRRFEREAQATASLRSPHTVELYDFGAAEDGTLYYIMELLDGLDLEQMVSLYGPLDPARVVWLAQQACLSLSEAHHQDLIHWDIKPANLYVCRLGMEHDVLKVLDFGLVRRLQPLEETSMVGSFVAGTPAYMAPEMITADEVDGRADLYSLGCVMYWTLTSRRVFEAGSVAEVLAAHLHQEPQPPSIHAPGVSPELDAVVMRCLAKDRAHRFDSALELHAALDGVRSDPPWSRKRAEAWWRERGDHQPRERVEA